MNTGAILIGIAMLILIIPFVANPLIKKSRNRIPIPISNKTGGNDQTQETLIALRDLDFDYQLGKVGEEDYSALRSSLMIAAAQSFETTKNEKDNQSLHTTCPECNQETQPGDTFCSGCGKELG